MDVQGKRYYVVWLLLGQSKQPTGKARKNDESPKNVSYYQKQMEFTIFRNTKVLGRRRIRSTAFIRRKESSKFLIGDVEFRGFYYQRLI